MIARRSVSFVAALAVFGSAALAAAPVKVTVVSVAGRSVFLDQGRQSGITTGARVKLFPAGSVVVEGVVVDVSSHSARVEVLPGTNMPPVGTNGEVAVSDAPPTTRPTTAPSTQPVAPPHAPWSRKETGRSPDMPLLAPAFSLAPGQRESTFHGRIFAEVDASTDQSGGRSNSYYIGRVGTSFTLTNPAGQGGQIDFAGQASRRGSDLTDSNVTEDDFIIDRFSYTIGDELYAPYRMELGRFYSYYLPEIGLVDGVEGAVRLQNGLNIGGGIGAYPLHATDRQEGDDLGFHLFVDYASEAPGKFNGTLGYQKTWHNGDMDRDVLIGRASGYLTPKLWLYGSAVADVYDGSEPVHSAGVDLTSAWLQARYTPEPTHGMSLSLSHYTWADIQRDDFSPVPVGLIRDGRVDRVAVSYWRDITKTLRPEVQAHYFRDQIDDGYGGEFNLTASGINKVPFDLFGGVFYDRGSFTEGMGFRGEIRPHTGALQVFVGYEYYRYTAVGQVSDSDYFTRQTVRGGLGYQIGNWYYSLTADKYFGDVDDSYRLGTFVEYRF